MIAWQIFISFKNLDRDGKPTPDSVLADDLYQYLSRRGFRVFFSNRSLEKLGISAYKREIEDALDRAKVLIVVGTSIENISSEWVRYEWDSFHSDIIGGAKQDGRIFVYADDIQLTTLPRALRQSQVFEHGQRTRERLGNFIQNSLNLRPALEHLGKPWYRVLTGYGPGAPEVDIECKQCEYRTDFTPAARESPPARCPRCSLE